MSALNSITCGLSTKKGLLKKGVEETKCKGTLTIYLKGQQSKVYFGRFTNEIPE